MSTSAGLIVVDDEGNTIIVQQYGKSWCFPKGHREEEDETIMHTASREFIEETGMVSMDNPITFGYSYACPIKKCIHLKLRDEWTSRTGAWFSGVCFTHRDAPINVTITRPSFTGKGWNGDDKEITYFLATPSGTSPHPDGAKRLASALDLSGERDPSITDLKIINVQELGKYVYGRLMHPAEFNAFYDVWKDYEKREQCRNAGAPLYKFRLDHHVTEHFSNPSLERWSL